MANKKDEKKIRPSRLFAFISVFPFTFLTIATTIIAVSYFDLLIFVSIILAFITWYKYIYIMLTEYRITNETIIKRTGVIARTFNSLELYRVKDYVVHQTVALRIFNLMTVTLMTNDVTNPIFKIEGIPFSDLDKEIRDLVQKARRDNQIYEIT